VRRGALRAQCSRSCKGSLHDLGAFRGCGHLSACSGDAPAPPASTVNPQAGRRPRSFASQIQALPRQQLRRISGKSGLAEAFRYALNRWSSFCLFLEDGRVAIDNNPAERGMRPVGVGRRYWLFAGSDAGGETRAQALTLIETAKMNGLDSQADLADVLARIHDYKINPAT